MSRDAPRESLPRKPSLHRRLFFAAVAAVAVVTLASFVIAYVAVRGVGERAFETRLRQTAASLLGSLTRIPDGTLSLEDGAADQPEFARPRSGWYWQAERNGAVVLRSRSLGSDTVPATGGTLHGMELLTVTSAERGGEQFRITVAGPRTVLDSTVAAELKPIALILATLCIALALSLHLVIRRALRPLEALTDAISSLQARNPGTLALTGVREVDQAADAINGLLAQTRELVQINRDAAARLAHALKTPLAQMAAHAGRADRETARRIEAAVETMRRQIDLQLGRLRQAGAGDAGPREWTMVRPIADDLLFAFARREAARSIRSDISCDDTFEAPVELADLEELLGNILDNAFRHARSRVTVDARLTPGVRRIAVSDDGPGFPTDMLSGHTGEAGRLGLALAQDIVARSGGTMSCANPPGGGAVVELAWAEPVQFESGSSRSLNSPVPERTDS